MIEIPATMHSDLQWEAIKQQVDELKKTEQQITWQFHLGLEHLTVPLDDPMLFSALCLSLKMFTKELWPLLDPTQQRAILYRGTGDFPRVIPLSSKQKEERNGWNAQRAPVNQRHAERLFVADAFVYYCQMLCHHLPDELPVVLDLDMNFSASDAEKLHLLSQERFEHLQLEIRGLLLSSSCSEAICLPEEKTCSEETLGMIQQLLQKVKKPYRIIAEPFLTQEWAGVDILHVLPTTLSDTGKRMLQGFEAAGGEVVFFP